MNKITTRSRVHRTLSKLNCFRYITPSDQSYDELSSKWSGWQVIGEVFDERSYAIFVVFEEGIVLQPHSMKLAFASMNSIRSKEGNASNLQTLIIEAQAQVFEIVILTKTGKYSDIFEVYRFFLRCIEDNAVLDS